MARLPCSLDWWKRQAGDGPIDDRCARTGPHIRDLMRITDLMPLCLFCRRQVVLVGRPTAPPVWTTIDGRDPVCRGGRKRHEVPPLGRPVTVRRTA